MFDVGFGEILLIMVISLVVLGPEKLPKLAADIGRWIGRARPVPADLRRAARWPVLSPTARTSPKAR